MRCRGLQRLVNPAYLGGFLCSGLLRVAPYCVPGGIRVVSEWYQEAVDYASLAPTHYELSVYVPPQRLGDAGAYQENRSSRSLLLRQPVAAKKSSLDSAK